MLSMTKQELKRLKLQLNLLNGNVHLIKNKCEMDLGIKPFYNLVIYYFFLPGITVTCTFCRCKKLFSVYFFLKKNI